MQYKVLNFEIKDEEVSFWSLKIIPQADKLKEMEKTLNELAQDGWRVHQMSTNALTYGGGVNTGGGGSFGYNVLVILEKE